MSVIHKKLNEHDEEAKKLLAKEIPLRESIIQSLQRLEVVWGELVQQANSRRQKLTKSLNIHKYFEAVKKLDQWAVDLRTKITGYVYPRSVSDAHNLIKSHQERLVEIEARDSELKELRETGQRIMTEQPEHKAEIQRVHRRLQVGFCIKL